MGRAGILNKLAGVIAFSAAVLLFIPSGRAQQQDQVTLTTYFPSARVHYTELRAMNNVFLGEAGGPVVFGTDAASVTLQPGALLTVERPGGDVYIDLNADTAQAAGLRFRSAGNLGWSFTLGAGAASTHMLVGYGGAAVYDYDPMGPLVFAALNEPKMRVESTTGAGASLQFSNATTAVAAGDGSLIGLDANEDALIAQNESAEICFLTENIKRMCLFPSGSMSIGSPPPVPPAGAKLFIDGPALGLKHSSAEIRLFTDGPSNEDWEFGTARGHFRIIVDPAGVNDMRFYLSAEGRWGIGRTWYNSGDLWRGALEVIDNNPRVLIDAADSSPELNFRRTQGGVDYFQNFYTDINGALALWNGTAGNTFYSFQDGSVQIGPATNPNTGTLRVGGDVRIRGTYFCNQVDVAERFASNAGPLEAGDVVVIDSARAGHLSRSAGAYDPAVAGVISGAPGVVLGEGAGEAQVALTGRVPTKVTAENGPIARGDLLVSASKPGYAMRADRARVRSGMVLGKALGALPHGESEGMIPVLVNLQ